VKEIPHSHVHKWLREHPDATLQFASEVIDALYDDGEGRYLGHDDAFPSGADYIDRVAEAISRAGLRPLITSLQDEADARNNIPTS